MTRSLLLLLSLALITGCATPQPTPAPTQRELRLGDLMARRLELAREVAWTKYQNNTPVRDPKREEELLTSLTTQGAALGLPAETVQTFFRAQIDASCTVQEELIHGWKRGLALPATAPLDLKKDIRPRLNAVSTQLLAELVLLRNDPASKAFFDGEVKKILRNRGFSWRVTSQATAPLRRL